MKQFEDFIVPMVLPKAGATQEDFGKPVIEQQQKAREEFPLLVAQSGLHLWKPGDPIAEQGTRFLIGVETASLYDMRLLDALVEAMASGKVGKDRLDVFHCSDIQYMEDFEPYVPTIGKVFQTPVVGRWKNGILLEKAWGAAGRNLVSQYYGLTVDLTLKSIELP